MEPAIRRYVDELTAAGANFVVHGAPIAENVTENVASYLAYLDLFERVTATPSGKDLNRADG
jgi:hypothetical protein